MEERSKLCANLEEVHDGLDDVGAHDLAGGCDDGINVDAFLLELLLRFQCQLPERVEHRWIAGFSFLQQISCGYSLKWR